MLHTLDDHFHEECGVFGIYGDREAAEKTYLGLYALQHRGQESAGIASSDGSSIRVRKGTGLVWSVFADPDAMPPLRGIAAIGHNRYSTKGSSDLVNAQPLSIECKAGKIAVAHNGTIANSAELRREL
ncbi:MAG TPA: amidophosphoribosyltransferase, partial [Deltaproteobacteria bacterium]|nr:amidophosphoribosyltransferase [Deltaproteobacteria bacterium]